MNMLHKTLMPVLLTAILLFSCKQKVKQVQPETKLLTEAVYPTVADENAGFNVPELKDNELKVATEFGVLVTVSV